jgi:lipopolysaccharide biosynthesis regulator YciM
LAGVVIVTVESLSMAVQLKPKLAKARWLRGRAFADLGRYKEAVADLEEAVRLDTSLQSQVAPILERIRNE